LRTVTDLAPLILTLIVCSLAFARAKEPPLPCSFEKFAVIVCKNGVHNYRVIRESLSRTGKLAITWTTKNSDDMLKSELRDDEAFNLDSGIKNVVVRIPDGKVMKELEGAHYGDAQRYNHNSNTAIWSVLDQWLIVATDNKWETDSANVYYFSDDGSVQGPFNLIKFCTEAARQFFTRKGKHFEWENYSNRIDVQEINLSGDVKAKFSMLIPKGELKDDFLQIDLAPQLKSEPGGMVAKIKSIKESRYS
jgi:hypothetical protein